MKLAPDKWKIVEITAPDGEVHYKVFGSWGGGYIDGDSWRMNSGIKTVYKDGEYFVVMGYSGSAYLCHEEAEGTMGYGGGVLAGFLERDGIELVDNGVEFLTRIMEE